MRVMSMLVRGLGLSCLAMGSALAQDVVVPPPDAPVADVVPAAAATAGEATVDVGGVRLRIPLSAGYVPVSGNSPELVKTLQAAVPPGISLLDAYVSESDLRRLLLGLEARQTRIILAALDSLRNVDFDKKDWDEFRPEVARQMGGLDMDKLMGSVRQGANERLTEAVGMDVQLKITPVGQPRVYAAEGDAIRYMMRLQVGGSMAGQAREIQQVVLAGAIARIRGRLVYVYLSHPYDSDADAVAMREQLDAFLDRVFQANAPSAAPVPAVASPAAAPAAAAKGQ